MAKKSGSKPAAAAGAKKAAGGKKKGGRKTKRSWKIYVRRSLNEVNKKLTLSSKTSKIFNSFINDMFERLATEAAHLARVNKRRTLGSREVQTAVRLTLPTELARHAMSEGTRAIAKIAQ